MYELIIAPKLTQEISPAARKFLASSVKKAENIVEETYEYIGAGTYLPQTAVKPLKSYPYFAPDSLINGKDEQVAKFIRIA